MKRHNAKDLPALLLEKAREDVAAVEALVDDERVVDGIVLFHAQQAAEKTLKSVLSAESIPFRMTHDLSDSQISLPTALGLCLVDWDKSGC